RLEPRPSEAEIKPRLAGAAREKIRAAHIREKANACFGHGEGQPFRRNAMRTMHRKTDTATHIDAVHQRDIRLWITLDIGVEQIFLAPEINSALVACAAPIMQRANITTRAESPVASTFHDHALNCVVTRPFAQLRVNEADHIEG